MTYESSETFVEYPGTELSEEQLMSDRARTEYRYEKLTWPEINDAVDLGKVCIVPCGADRKSVV